VVSFPSFLVKNGTTQFNTFLFGPRPVRSWDASQTSSVFRNTTDASYLRCCKNAPS